jgi:tetratricopeptide (TPR) repeat protein
MLFGKDVVMASVVSLLKNAFGLQSLYRLACVAALSGCLLVALPNHQVAAQEGVASQDLIALYQSSEQRQTVEELNELIEELKVIALDRQRTAGDRAYARDLLSWSLNRRGELRSDLAAERVDQGLNDEASELDKAAAADFRASLKLNPQRWRARHNLAIALAMANDYADAIEQFGIVIQEQPSYANAYFNRGELYFQTDNYAEAIADYTAAIRLQPNDAQYRNSRAHSLLMINRNKEALADYRKAAELDSTNGQWWADLADAYQFLGQYREAMSAYRLAIEADRELGRAYQNAAWLMATCPDTKVRNPKNALEAARRAIELDGDGDPRYLDTLAAAQAANGQFSDAVETVKDAMKNAAQVSTPEDMEAMKQRMVAYQNKKGFFSKPAADAGVSSTVRTAAGDEPIGTGTKRRR